MLKRFVNLFYQVCVACFLVTTITPSAHANAFDDVMKAIKVDDASSISALLARGIDPNTTDDKGRSILHLALLEQSLKSASVIAKHPGVNLNHKTPQDETPLMMAVFRGYKPLAAAMIKAGALVNKTGWAPLHYAATNGHLDLVSLLLEEHAYIDAEAPSKTTPLMMAARHGHLDVVNLLLNEGADPTAINVHGLSAIDFATKSERRDIAEAIGAHVRKGNLRKGWN
jgi:uncharacterized protein